MAREDYQRLERDPATMEQNKAGLLCFLSTKMMDCFVVVVVVVVVVGIGLYPAPLLILEKTVALATIFSSFVLRVPFFPVFGHFISIW